MPTLARWWVAPGLASFALAGCTSSGSPAVEADAEATCPTSLFAAIGVPCATEGLTCWPEYPCGISSAIATCTCTAGLFVCADVTGKTLDDGGLPHCPAQPASGTCPATETLASERPCVESGLMCAYPSTCSGPREYDVCECFTGTLTNGQVGLRFECPTPCDYDAGLADEVSAAPTVDATTIDAPALDAPVEDGPRDARALDAPGG
jgi:hypothetical protein